MPSATGKGIGVPWVDKSVGGACPECAVPTRNPTVMAAASYTVGVEATLSPTVYANGVGAPYEGCTRNVHHLYWSRTETGTKNFVVGVHQSVTGSAVVNFTFTPQASWVGVVNLWVLSFDACAPTRYTADYAASQVVTP